MDGLSVDGAAWDALTWGDFGDAELDAQRYRSAAEAYVESARLALAEDDFVLRTAALGNLSIAYLHLGELDAARDAVGGAIEACKRQGTDQSMCKLLNIEGAIHQRLGDPQAATASYRRALEYADALGDDRRRVEILNNLAVASMNCGALDEALEFIDRVEALGRRYDDKLLLATAWTNRGETLHLMKRDEEALEPLQEALAIRRKLAGDRQVSETLIGLAVTQKALGRLDDTLASLDEALAIADRMGLGLDRIVILAHQADVYASLGDRSASMAAAEASQSALEDTAALERLALVQSALSRAHEAVGNLEEALEFNRKAQETQAHLHSERTAADMHALQVEMETREAAKRRRWLTATGTGALVVLGFLVIAVWRGRRHARHQCMEMDGTLKEMESALQLNAQALHLASAELADLRNQLGDEATAEYGVLHPQPAAPDGSTTHPAKLTSSQGDPAQPNAHGDPAPPRVRTL